MRTRSLALLVAATISLINAAGAQSPEQPKPWVAFGKSLGNRGSLKLAPRELYLACRNIVRRQKLLAARIEVRSLTGIPKEIPKAADDPATDLDSSVVTFCSADRLPHNRAGEMDPLWTPWTKKGLPSPTSVRYFATREQAKLDNGESVFDQSDAEVHLGKLDFDEANEPSEGTKLWLSEVSRYLHKDSLSKFDLKAEAFATKADTTTAGNDARRSAVIKFLEKLGLDPRVSVSSGDVIVSMKNDGTGGPRKSTPLKLASRLANVGSSGASVEVPPKKDEKKGALLSGGSDATSALVIGFTNFVIDQAKEEIALYTTRSVMQKLCAANPAVKWIRTKPGDTTVNIDSSKQAVAESRKPRSMRHYLEGTCRLFPFESGAALDVYLPSTSALREAILSDMGALPVTFLNSVRDSAKVEFKEKITLASELVTLLQAVARGRDPVASLARLGTDHLSPVLNDSSSAAIVALARFSRFLGVYETTRSDIELLADDSVPADTVRLYALKTLVLNVVNNDSLPQWKEWTITPKSGLIKSSTVELSLDVERLASVSREVDAIAADIRTLRTRLAQQSDSAKAPKLIALLSLLRSTADLVEAPLELDLDSTALPQTKRFLEPTVDVVDRMTRSDYVGALRSMLGVVASIDTGLVTGRVGEIKVISFVADVASAQTPDEVTRAFSRYADPLSGLNGKRNAAAGMYWAVNAYFGGAVGTERVRGAKSVSRSGAAVFGPMLPVGLEVGWPVMKGAKWSHPRLLLQLFDLGAVASLRLSGNDSVQTAPTKVNQIFAPGLFVGTGIGNSPVALLAGAELAPQSRIIETAGVGGATNTRRYDTTRFLLGITIDVPLFVRPFFQ